MHWRAEMAPRTHSSSMVFQAGRANRSRIASVTSNGVTVPSKSQMTEYGPAAKSGNFFHFIHHIIRSAAATIIKTSSNTANNIISFFFAGVFLSSTLIVPSYPLASIAAVCSIRI